MRQITRPHLTPFYVDAIRGVVRGGTKGAKVAFQILEKCCVFIATLSNEKRNFETPSEMIIP